METKVTPIEIGTTVDPHSVDLSGMIIAGRYKLIHQLGMGGMGAVWLAEQTDPVVRQVALKVIKPGMDSAQIIARFEAERQALALMDHPNIAKVLDGGLTKDLRPFFVMELVRGVPLTTYCDTAKLDLKQRLELFVQVCQAVQHAHQKGIIHRDLKPGNILVTLIDGKPVPKVIDFGVAKALHQKLTDHTVFTEVGSVVGTLEYMSPEQADLTALDIDTRSDIYSLGVILYELLTGMRPFDSFTLRRAGLVEMLRIIKEEEPPRPSTRVSNETDTLPGIAADRRTEPARLTKSLRGDLDWIVMKALEKERSRRYETANGFALDIQRYLADEPVLASPPSAAYRLRKFLKRNKGPVLAATLLLLVLVGGIFGTTWQMFRALDAEKQAKANEGKALNAASAERQAKDEEARQRKEAEAVAGLLEGIYKDADPFTQRKDAADLKTRLSSRLEAAAAELRTSFSGEPTTQARLLNALGMAQIGLGDSAKAGAYFKAAWDIRKEQLGASNADTLTSEANHAKALQDMGKLAEALPIYEDVLKQRKLVLGPDHFETLMSTNNLAYAYRAAGRMTEALTLYRENLEHLQRVLGPTHPTTLAGMNNLASTLSHAGQFPEAIEMAEKTLELRKTHLGADHPETIYSMNNLAKMYRDVGRLKDALPMQRETVKLMKAKLGFDHPATLTAMNNLGLILQTQGSFAEAIPVYQEALELQKTKLGRTHPETITSMHNLGATYKNAGKPELGLPLAEEAVKLAKETEGPDHPSTLQFMNTLANLYDDTGRRAEGLPLHKAAYEGLRAKFGMNHPTTITLLENYLIALEEARQYDKTEPIAREHLAFQRKTPGGDERAALFHLSMSLLAQEKFAEAEAVIREALAACEKRAPDSWTTFMVKSQLGSALAGQKRSAEAETQLLAGYEGLKARAAKIPPRFRQELPQSAERLVAFYEKWGKPDEARKWKDELARLKAEQTKPRTEK